MLPSSTSIHPFPEMLPNLAAASQAASGDAAGAAATAMLAYAPAGAGSPAPPASVDRAAREKSLYRRGMRDQRLLDSLTYSKERCHGAG